MISPQFLSACSARIKLLAIGITFNWVTSALFDWVLYPAVILWFGIVAGGIIMTFATFIVCYATILIYDYIRKDWLSLELIKDTLAKAKSYSGERSCLKFASTLLRKSDWLVLFFLSLKYDPAIVTIFARRGAYVGLGKRDWYIFVVCVLWSNFYWVFIMAMGISVFSYIGENIL